MKKYTRILRLIGLTLLVMLALIGIAIGGVVPLSKRHDERIFDDTTAEERLDERREKEADAQLDKT